MKQYFYYAQLLVIASLTFHFLISSYAIIIALILFIINLSHSEFRLAVYSNFLKNRVAIGFIALFFTYCLSFLVHQNNYTEVRLGLSGLEKKLSYLIFPLLMVNVPMLTARQVTKLFKVFVGAIVAGTMFALLAGLYYTIATNDLYYFDENKGVIFNNFMYHRLGSYIGMHAVYLSEYVLFALILVIHYSIQKISTWSRKQRAWSFSLIAYLIIIIFLLKSAAILLILLASIVIFGTYYLFKFRGALNIKKVTIISSVGLVLIVSLSYRAYNKIGIKSSYFEYDLSEPGGGNWNAINLRLAKWHAASIAVAENWVYGVGPGNTDEAMDKVYEDIGFEYALQLHYNPHNQFLQTFLAIGIIGLILFLALLVLIFSNAFRKLDVVFIVFMISLGLFSLSESILAVNKGVVFFTFFTCLFSYLPHKLSHYING